MWENGDDASAALEFLVDPFEGVGSAQAALVCGGVIPGSMASPGYVVRGKGSRGSRDEPHEGDAVLHLERDQEVARRARCRAAQRRPR